MKCDKALPVDRLDHLLTAGFVGHLEQSALQPECLTTPFLFNHFHTFLQSKQSRPGENLLSTLDMIREWVFFLKYIYMYIYVIKAISVIKK